MSWTASYADPQTFPFLVSTAGLPTRSALLGTECSGDLSTIVDFDRMTCPSRGKANRVGRVRGVVDSDLTDARERALELRVIIIVGEMLGDQRCRSPDYIHVFVRWIMTWFTNSR